MLVERMAPPGAELLVAARLDGVVPHLVIAAGGLWTEVLGDAVVVPLPAAPERVEARHSALCGPLRCSPAGAGRAALDVAAAAGWRPRRASCCMGADLAPRSS